MFSDRKYRVLIPTMILWFLCGIFVPVSMAKSCKVLVIMSYEKINPWCTEIKEGIDSVFVNSCELTYFYMDTKVNIEGGKQKAEDAYALFLNLKPDGVITVDDNAQSMFVLPYLKDKVKTPVMFCGVNAEAEKYGYPASNVSGVLERGHIRESVAFAKQLSPLIKTIGVLAKDSPSGRALLRQVARESDTYPAKIAIAKLLKTEKELKNMGQELKEQCDAIFMDSMEGLLDGQGNPLRNRDITRILAEISGKPIIGANQYHVKEGALCAVVKTGQEQGKTASAMLLKAIQGAPVADIPVTQNFKGKRVINVTVMEALGIKPKPIVLIGAKLIKTEK